jgi:hypothetical protein
MLALIWVGVILSHLGLLEGWILFWYIVSLVLKAIS